MTSGAPITNFSTGGTRHLTILFSDICGFSEWAARIGDVEASRLTRRLIELQEVIVTRGSAGQVLQSSGASVFAVFDKASDALNRALEIQRVTDSFLVNRPEADRPRLHMGLHMGEVWFREGERLELISRHVQRAQRVMEAAGPGQVFASEAVVEAGRDFLDLPREAVALQSHGEFYLKGTGTTHLCEIADRRFRPPAPPLLTDARRSETALLGRVELAGFRSLARLGEGPLGVVYEATRTDSDETVAIKVLAPGVGEDANGRQQFIETQRRAREQPWAGVVTPSEERLEHRPPFLVMERVVGQPVDAALAGAEPARVAGVFQAICDALAPAHAAAQAHGNLKPGNILLRADDSPALLDFGSAALIDERAAAGPSKPAMTGTPMYLAPEVLNGAARGPQADVYALGVLLFAVLAGREPFAGASVHQIVQAQLHEDPPLPASLNPAVPDGLQRICLKALEKNPSERYGSAQEMAGDLGRFQRGEVVRTRPTAYDNLLFHRVRKHVAQVREWSARGLLNDEESNRLLAAYEGLQRRGLPAVMEGRLYRFWQTLVYVGGWAVVNGALLWLVLQWNTLARAQKLLLGSLPALTAFALASAMMRLERFRLTFVALVVGILATPLLFGVWLYEFRVAAAVPESRLAQELFHVSDSDRWVTNQQLLLAALATLAVAAWVAWRTRTITHSAQTMAAAALTYAAGLLFFNLKPQVEHEQWAAIGVQLVPLLVAVAVVAHRLLPQNERSHQAAPWIHFAALLLIAILYAVSLYGLEEWTNWSNNIRRPASFLLLSMAGGAQTGIGLVARHYLQFRGRMAVLALVMVGLANVLVGLASAGAKNNWPADWWSPQLFGQAVPVVHLALPPVSLAIALLACRFQMFTFLGLGLAGFAASVHLLGNLYFHSVAAWPKWIMLCGVACFFVALYVELRRTRGRAADDVVGESRL